MSSLKYSISDSVRRQFRVDDESHIYLFGTHASMILFAMALVELCDDKKDDRQLEANIKQAIKWFTYCSAIAEDGGQDWNSSGDYLTRYFQGQDDENNVFESSDCLVRGLYPHRLTQFVDFGKIFVATCQAILLLSSVDSGYSWEKIEKLLSGLHQRRASEQPSNENFNQTCFNRHLQKRIWNPDAA